MKKIWLHQNVPSRRHIGKYLDAQVLQGVEHEPIFINIGNGAKAYIWRKHKTMYVTFRGSNGFDWCDIKANMDLRQHHLDSGGIVQKGYWLYLDSILPDLMNQILSNSMNINTLDFTGHSMGSTLAALSAFTIAKQINCHKSHLDVHCHVFGGPRFCDKKFSQQFMELLPNTSHTIMQGDCVPLINNGFQHCIRNFLYLEDHEYKADFSKTIIEKHSCKNYISSLKKLIDSNEQL